MSIIIQTCPECGADLEHMVFATNPPIKAWRCPKCKWEYRHQEKIKRVPFEPPKDEAPTGLYDILYEEGEL